MLFKKKEFTMVIYFWLLIKIFCSTQQGHLSEAWSRVTKNAIAETIIALTKMEEEFRSPVRCIATTRVGFALFCFVLNLVCIIACSFSVIDLNKF